MHTQEGSKQRALKNRAVEAPPPTHTHLALVLSTLIPTLSLSPFHMLAHSRPATAATASAKQPLPSTSGGGGGGGDAGPGPPPGRQQSATPAASTPAPAPAPAPAAFFRTPSGTAVEELAAGDPGGRAAADGDAVDCDFVLRRANGYFIYANVEGVSFQPADVPTGPFLFTVGDPAVLPGFSDAVRGARAGGRRRAHVPPGAGYQAFPGGLPQAPTFATRCG